MCFQQAQCCKSLAVHPALIPRTFRLTIPMKPSITRRIGKTMKINLNNYWREFEVLLVPNQSQGSNEEGEDEDSGKSQQ